MLIKMNPRGRVAIKKTIEHVYHEEKMIGFELLCDDIESVISLHDVNVDCEGFIHSENEHNEDK